MAIVTLTPQIVGKAGATPSANSLNAADTYKFRNSSKTLLRIANTGGSPSIVTLDTPGTVAGEAIANPTVSVPATTGVRIISLQPTSLFNDPSGIASFTQDQATGVTAEVYEVS